MRCYRYMSYEYGLKAFETRWFKVTRPSESNDPYDCVGIVTGDLRKEVFEACVRDNFVRLCEEHEGAKDIPSEVFSSPDRYAYGYENLNQSMAQFVGEYFAMKAQYAKEMAAVKGS